MKKRQLFDYTFNNIQESLLSPSAPSPGQLLNEAIQFLKQGDLHQAGRICRDVLEIQPDHPDFLNLLGVVESRHGRHIAAEELITRAISIKPAIAEYHNNLGRVLEAQVKLLEAWKAYETALGFKPDHPDALLNLARLLSKMGDVTAAVACYEKLIDRYPARVDVWLELASLYRNTRDPATAEAVYHRGLSANPGAAVILLELGIHLQGLGRITEAEAAFRKALQANPALPRAYYHLAHVRNKKSPDGSLGAAIEKILGQGGLNDTDTSLLHFALGKVYHDSERYDEAFKHYCEGNAIRKKKYAYDAGAEETFMERIMETFDREFIESHQLSESLPGIPVFIIGVPRSGSTLVEQILASHPEVAGAGELSYFLAKSKIIPKQFGTRNLYPFCVRELNHELLVSVAWEYLGMLKKSAGSGRPRRITDKQLYNYLHLGFIRILFPKARIIHCRREPLDNCLAIYFTSFANDDHQYAYDLEEIGKAYRHYQKLMQHWHVQLPEPYLEIDYEKLVQNQEEESRRLIQYVGLEWDERCLEFYKTPREINTASNWQVRQPLYTDSLQRWKHYENYLDPLRRALEQW